MTTAIPEELWGDPTITDHCHTCHRPIHRYHGTSWLHDTQPDEPGIDDHLARPHTTDMPSPEEAS